MVKCLEMEGVRVAFGYPGAAICPFYDALSGSSIRHVLVRTEQNAAHSASGYSRVSGKPGVCIATSGPGATNLLTGIASAYMDSIACRDCRTGAQRPSGARRVSGSRHNGRRRAVYKTLLSRQERKRNTSYF